MYRATRVFNLAQGDIVSWGGLIAFSLLVRHGFTTLAALPVIVVATAALGFGVERIAIAPLTRALSFGWVLTTLGMSVVLRNVAELQWGPDPLRVPAFIDRAPVSLLGSPFRVDFMVTIVGAVTLAALLELADRKTIIGKAMVATAINRELARLRGINVGLRRAWTCSRSTQAAASASSACRGSRRSGTSSTAATRTGWWPRRSPGSTC